MSVSYLKHITRKHIIQSASGGASSRFRFNFSEKGASWAILNALLWIALLMFLSKLNCYSK